ncbi:hypothetical protein AB7W30_19390 [Providencia manganoxydans]|uniref:hypothetical protein n=1 Tax=Providencia manganoxydans TaxID=2923283 RepID=UPI0032DA7A2B
MFQPHLLALSGPSNSGKTTTIKMVYELLLKHFKNEGKIINVHDCLSKRATSDIKRILTIGEFKIGIESQGDPVSHDKKHHRLRDSLPFFDKEGCHLIICTSRTKGQTVEYIKACEPKYKIIFFTKKREPLDNMKSEWSHSSQAIYKQTIDLYNEFLKSSNAE